jgi:hypothetical protein
MKLFSWFIKKDKRSKTQQENIDLKFRGSLLANKSEGFLILELLGVR